MHTLLKKTILSLFTTFVDDSGNADLRGAMTQNITLLKSNNYILRSIINSSVKYVIRGRII